MPATTTCLVTRSPLTDHNFILTVLDKNEIIIDLVTPPVETSTKRKIYSLELKWKIGRSAERLDNNLAVARYYGVHESNVRLWRKKYAVGKAETAQMELDENELTKVRETAKPRAAFFPLMEKKLMSWFTEERSKDMPLSRRMIMAKARELMINNKENTNATFKSSSGWFYGFCRRRKLSRRKITHTLQRLPNDFKMKIDEFMVDVNKAREEYCIHLVTIPTLSMVSIIFLSDSNKSSLLANMDEVPVFFDLQNGSTYHYVGAREVGGKRTVGTKQRATVVLCATSTGLMLAPYIIFKGDPPEDKAASKVGLCFVNSNKTAWMTEEIMLDWLKKVYFAQPVPFKARRILIVDLFAVHKKKSIQDFVRERNVKYVVIPGGLTHLLQPLDVSLNKPIKDRMRIMFEEWFNKTMSDSKGVTKSGVIRAPTKDDLRSWLEIALQLLDRSAIIKSFKVCGINLASDQSENHLLSDKLKSDKEISSMANEVEKFYEDYERFDQPYEDFESLLNEMRENQYMIYDLQKVLHSIFSLLLQSSFTDRRG